MKRKNTRHPGSHAMSLNRLSADTVIGIAFAAIALYLVVQGARALAVLL